MVSDLQWKDALVIGGAQALALIPGSSRSGTTITAGMFLGLTREAAARFSFLLSIPAVLASGLFTLGDIGKTDPAGHPPVGWTPTLIAAVVAFVVGYASIAWLLRWLTSHSTVVFSAYRVIVGVLVIGLLAGNVISATK
jgi:undecaprenyl-diphosphatase